MHVNFGVTDKSTIETLYFPVGLMNKVLGTSYENSSDNGNDCLIIIFAA